MNGVPLISKNLSGASNVNVSGDVTAQTIQSSLGIYLNGLRSNVQTHIDTVALSKQGICGNNLDSRDRVQVTIKNKPQAECLS